MHRIGKVYGIENVHRIGYYRIKDIHRIRDYDNENMHRTGH